DRLKPVFDGSLLGGGRYHHASPRVMPQNTPASIMPATLAAMSNDGQASMALAAATPSGSPEMREISNSAPPKGRCAYNAAGYGGGGASSSF
ncbi:hypothetical protein ACC724_38265, partial [Rhizobium ruizarguesonis]